MYHKYRKYKYHYFKNEFEVNVTTLTPNERAHVRLIDIDRIILGWSHPVFEFLERKPRLERCFTMYKGDIGFPMKLRDESECRVEECCQWLRKIRPQIRILPFTAYAVPTEGQEVDVRWLI